MPQPDEDFAQLIVRIKDAYQVNESEIGRRVGVSSSAVNTWVNRRRQAPRRATLEKLAAAFPKICAEEIYAAAGRRTPAADAPEREARILDYFRELTPEQQELVEIQVRALAEYNQRNFITPA